MLLAEAAAHTKLQDGLEHFSCLASLPECSGGPRVEGAAGDHAVPVAQVGHEVGQAISIGGWRSLHVCDTAARNT